MQIEHGIRSILSIPLAYRLFQSAAGATATRRWLVQEAWRVTPGMRVVDIGCGPGDVLEDLPDVHYVGVDISSQYIARAKQQFGAKGKFFTGTSAILRSNTFAANADLVICTGVLHHIDDSTARQLLADALATLKPGGRFVGLEPTYLRHQSRLSKWIISKDRGQCIRDESSWRELADAAGFSHLRVSVLTAMLRLPYTHILIEGVK